ncbi:hypothetical protein ACHAXR_002928 [Thalassiosira sp. AJA248-18]
MMSEVEVEEKVDALERAVLEIDAMVSIFCQDFTGEIQAGDNEFVITTVEALDHARTIIDCPPDAFDAPRIDVEMHVHTHSDVSSITRLRICLPPGYPSFSHAEVTVLSIPKNLPRNHFDELSTKLQLRAKENSGSEAMLEIINECRDVMENWDMNKLSNQVLENELPTDNANKIESISRRWIWVHHITNSSRLKQIVTEAQNLKLGGYLKGGYPGVVLVEGSTLSCDEFVGWIKGNKSRPGGFGRNWGHHVRGETTVDNRQLPESFEELKDDMGKLGALCKEFGVEEEFREFILQHK